MIYTRNTGSFTNPTNFIEHWACNIIWHECDCLIAVFLSSSFRLTSRWWHMSSLLWLPVGLSSHSIQQSTWANLHNFLKRGNNPNTISYNQSLKCFRQWDSIYTIPKVGANLFCNNLPDNEPSLMIDTVTVVQLVSRNYLDINITPIKTMLLSNSSPLPPLQTTL